MPFLFCWKEPFLAAGMNVHESKHMVMTCQICSVANSMTLRERLTCSGMSKKPALVSLTVLCSPVKTALQTQWGIIETLGSCPVNLVTHFCQGCWSQGWPGPWRLHMMTGG